MNKKITLAFITTAGRVEDSFLASERLFAIKHTILEKLELDLHKEDEFVVTLNGKALDQGETLEQLGLTDGIVLTIERREAKVTLTFVTPGGQIRESFPLHANLHVAKCLIMKRLELDKNKEDDFVVTLDGTILDQGESLEQLRLKDGAVLNLEYRETKVSLVFATTAGDAEESFPIHMHLHAVKILVMKRLSLDPQKADDFVVARDGDVLDQGESLEQLGLTDGAVLTIERREVVKIWTW
jgi:hypothetical protein